MNVVSTNKEFYKEVLKIAKSNKRCEIFSFYVKRDLFIITIEDEKHTFDFQKITNEKAIIKMIDRAIKIINKYKFQQLSIIE